MKVHVLFFGATAAIAGGRKLNLEVVDGTTTDRIFDNIRERFPPLSNHKLHIAINQQYATGDEIVCDGDELAIFTAVSGG